MTSPSIAAATAYSPLEVDPVRERAVAVGERPRPAPRPTPAPPSPAYPALPTEPDTRGGNGGEHK